MLEARSLEQGTQAGRWSKIRRGGMGEEGKERKERLWAEKGAALLGANRGRKQWPDFPAKSHKDNRGWISLS